MKSKLGLTLISLLSVVVLVGVGFAAWIITNPDVSATVDGSIQVEEVKDQRYTISGKSDGEAIIFGHKTESSITNPWLQVDDAANAENLTGVITITVKYNEYNDLPDNFVVKMESGKLAEGGTWEPDTKYAAAVTAGYVAFPTVSYTANGSVAEVSQTIMWGDSGTSLTVPKTAFTNDGTENKLTLELTVKFNWGTKFGSKNPYTYYNNKMTYSESVADAAKADLIKIKTDLDGLQYRMTITPSATTQA